MVRSRHRQHTSRGAALPANWGRGPRPAVHSRGEWPVRRPTSMTMTETMVHGARWPDLAARIGVTRRLVRPLQLVAAPVLVTILVWRARIPGELASLLLSAGAAISISAALDDPAAITLA